GVIEPVDQALAAIAGEPLEAIEDPHGLHARVGEKRLPDFPKVAARDIPLWVRISALVFRPTPAPARRAARYRDQVAKPVQKRGVDGRLHEESRSSGRQQAGDLAQDRLLFLGLEMVQERAADAQIERLGRE